MSKPIQLYTACSPNGYMISVYLEFLKVPYEATALQLFKNETKADWYVKINPNGRIPAIVDPNTNVTMSQTGAILQYLAETYDKDFKYSYKPGTPEYYLEKELLFLEVTENGPTHAQAVHYNLLNKGASEYAATRILNEIKRIYGVAEQYLINNPSGLFFVGDHYSTVDVAFYFWIVFSSKLDIDLSVWPKLAEWAETFGAIEEVKAGSQKPPNTFF